MAGRVVDAADLLSGEVEARIGETLQRHEEATGNQIVVATIPSLGGTTIEQYGVELGRRWGIGPADRSNGAVLIVAPARSEEHTSELQSIMRISYAVFCLKKNSILFNIQLS